MDVSQLVDAESPLAFRDFYEAVFSSPELAAYVIRVGEDGSFTFEDANEVVERISGLSLAEIKGSPPAKCMPPDVAECLVHNLRRCIEANTSLAYNRSCEVHGSTVVFKTSLAPIVRGPGKPAFVVGLTRDVTAETALIENAQRNAVMLRSLGIALPSAIYLLDLETKSINFIGGDEDKTRQEWRRGAESAGAAAADLYIHPDDRDRARAHWEEMSQLADGEVTTISYRIRAHDGEYRRFLNRETVFDRNAEGGVSLVLGISEDMTEHDRVEQEVRDLSSRMFTLQIDERRRIAEELHDSTGQHMMAAALALRNAQGFGSTPQEREDNPALFSMIDDAIHCLDEAQREIRVLSYLLHPPKLLSRGLPEAITAFATGFGRRAGLNVKVSIAPEARLIDDDIAVHLFRVCQEALTNVYRHAHAHRAHVELEIDDCIRLIVTDDGIGFDETAPDRILGVGLPGMRERMGRLGGTVRILGDPDGTTLTATIPLRGPHELAAVPILPGIGNRDAPRQRSKRLVS